MSMLKDLPLMAFLMMTAFSFKAGAAAVRTVPTSMAIKAVAGAPSQFKSYREWKNEQIQEAQAGITTIKAQIDQRKQARQLAQGVDPNLAMKKSGSDTDAGLERQLQKEQYDLEVAKDLSVTDYFVGYLTKVSDKKSAINEVAGKLTADEVAELMNAYANSVFGGHGSDLPTSAANVFKDSVK